MMAALHTDGIMHIFPSVIANTLKKADVFNIDNLEEIRLRAGKPVVLGTGLGDRFISVDGRLTDQPTAGSITASGNNLADCIAAICENSVYALQKEMQSGYMTLKGGHRVGFCGRVTAESEGKVSCIRDFSGINVRIAREYKGCSLKLVKYIRSAGRICNTLVISPPQCGKTTILRDLARILGGYMKVAVVDERSEIAGCVDGMPSFDVGLKTDVMDGCPKKAGIEMLLRSMSPEVIITDELGNQGDREAVISVLNAGTAIIASAHGNGIILESGRKELKDIMSDGFFSRLAVLSRSEGPGTLEEVYDGNDLSVIYRRCGNVA